MWPGAWGPVASPLWASATCPHLERWLHLSPQPPTPSWLFRRYPRGDFVMGRVTRKAKPWKSMSSCRAMEGLLATDPLSKGGTRWGQVLS